MKDRRETEQPTLSEKILAWTGAFVAIAVAAQNAVLTYVVLTREIPQNNQTIVGQLLGNALTLMGVIVGYFYVASVGSRKKDEVIATQAKTAQTAGAALAPSPDSTVTTVTSTEIKPPDKP